MGKILDFLFGFFLAMAGICAFLLMVLLTIFLLSSIAKELRADDAYVGYGVGVGNSALDSFSETKHLVAGVEKSILIPPVIRHIEVGSWFDTRRDLGRKSSGYVGVSYGLNIENQGSFVECLWGVAAVTNRDSMLGGNLQFMNDLGIGIKDSTFGTSIGLYYKHISSAGIFQPNEGRDLISIRLGVPF